MSKNTLAKATLVIVAMNLASKILGFVRETVIANEYGATFATDAYNAAYTIPYFLQMVLGMALVTSIVPVVTKYALRGNKEEANRIASITLNWTVLFMAALTVLGMLASGAIVRLITPGFTDDTAALTTRLTVIMFPSLIFMGAGMLITGILNADKRFAVAAFAPGFSNLVIIFFVIFLGGLGIDYLAVGTLAGMAGILLVQLPSLARSGFKYHWDWDIRHVEVRGIFYNLLPIFLGTAVNQIYLAINRYFASGLSEGSISALNYAGKLMNLPLGVFVLAVSSAIFPTLSEHAVREDRQALGATLNRGLKIVLLITLPAAAGLMALSEPIVQLLFERGAFDYTATVMTSGALVWFSLGMFAMAVNMVLTRAYYAVSDVKTPLYVSGVSIVVNIIASQLLVGSMGHNGLALANTVAAVFSAVAMYALLKKHLPQLYFTDLMISAGKAIIASLLTVFAAVSIFAFLAATLSAPGRLSLLVQVMGAVAAGTVVYGVSILVLKEKEVFLLWGRFRDRLRR